MFCLAFRPSLLSAYFLLSSTLLFLFLLFFSYPSLYPSSSILHLQPFSFLPFFLIPSPFFLSSPHSLDSTNRFPGGHSSSPERRLERPDWSRFDRLLLMGPGLEIMTLLPIPHSPFPTSFPHHPSHTHPKNQTPHPTLRNLSSHLISSHIHFC